MPMENMVHMFGGTKKKSTLVDERVILYHHYLSLISLLIVSLEKTRDHLDRRYWTVFARTR